MTNEMGGVYPQIHHVGLLKLMGLQHPDKFPKQDRSATTADSYIPQSMPKWLVTVAHYPDALAEKCHSLAAKNLGAAEVRSTCPKMVPTVMIIWMEWCAILSHHITD